MSQNMTRTCKINHNITQMHWNYCSNSARQATLPQGSFLAFFLTCVTTYHDRWMTLMTAGVNILTTMKTNGEDILMTLMTSGEDILTTALGLVTTL